MLLFRQTGLDRLWFWFETDSNTYGTITCMKKVLVINSHPDPESLCAAMAQRYHDGALEAGAESKLINLIDLDFDPILRYGYRKVMPLEPDLVAAQEAMQWAEHIVFVHPNWWGTYPALLKGFFDRVLVPGFAFKFQKGALLPDKLLKGRTGRIITTMDTPGWYYTLVHRNIGIHAIRRNVLAFCGIKPVKVSYYRQVKASSAVEREVWLQEVAELGRAQA